MKDLGHARDLRPVVPISRDGLVPAVLLVPPPELRWVAVADLVVDPEYQREISERSIRLIRQIVKGWDWGRVKALNVRAHADGTFEVVDGQHTAIAAATHGGIARLPCLVKPSSGTARAADDFVGLNSLRLGVTAAQRFWASVAGGDPDAMAIVAAADDTGLRLLRVQPSRWRPGDTVAYSALLNIARGCSGADLTQVLDVAAKSGLAPVRALHLKALARLIAAPEYRDTVSGDRLVEELRGDADGIERAARDARAELGGALDAHFATELFRRAA